MLHLALNLTQRPCQTVARELRLVSQWASQWIQVLMLLLLCLLQVCLLKWDMLGLHQCNSQCNRCNQWHRCLQHHQQCLTPNLCNLKCSSLWDKCLLCSNHILCSISQEFMVSNMLICNLMVELILTLKFHKFNTKEMKWSVALSHGWYVYWQDFVV